MKCPETTALVDVLYEECASEDRGRILTHLETCQECQEQWSRLRAVLAAADRWAAPSPTPGISERALARIAAERARSSPADRPLIASQHLLGFLLFGVAAASLSLLLSSGVHEEGVSPLTIGWVGVLWTALYAGVGLLTLHGKYRRPALAALVGSGISLLATPMLSMPAVIEASRRWVETAQASSLLNGAVILAGVLYASMPVLVAGATTVRGSRSTVLADAARLAGLYALLIAPSVCVQCQHVALGLTVAWVAGMLPGAFLGGLVGASLSARLRTATT